MRVYTMGTYIKLNLKQRFYKVNCFRAATINLFCRSQELKTANLNTLPLTAHYPTIYSECATGSLTVYMQLQKNLFYRKSIETF